MRLRLFYTTILTLLTTSAVLAAGYRCTPCSQNYYCTGGVSYECPSETPVTIGTGAKSASECITCAQRDGASYPFYDEISGKCMACWQVPATTTPYWNGSTCAACPENTQWDNENLTCKEIEVQTACAFTIPHEEGTLCLVESVGVDAYGSLSPQNENDPLYNSIEGATPYSDSYEEYPDYWPDYWAGAKKYCQDKGMRIPTMAETVSITNALWGTDYDCYNICDDGQSGCCTYWEINLETGQGIQNQEMLNWLATGSKSTYSESCGIMGDSPSDLGNHYRSFHGSLNHSESRTDPRSNTSRAICVKTLD